ncbi:MAG: LPS export ABC transporter ATP-binding protein [Candidatus Aminicenantales bacterium]
MDFYLEAVEVEKSFGRKKVVDRISLRVKKGEVVGLLGPNGAGKTTTFSLIVGLLQAERGSIFLNGEDISDLSMYIRARKGLTLLPQESSVFRGLTVEENLLAAAEALRNRNLKGDVHLQEALRELGLEKLASVKAYSLSGGERRRLEIARALITNPDFFLLDEPFTGIDPIAILDIQEIILSLKKKGIGVLLTDHRVRETLKIVDRAYIISGGRIFQEGRPEDLAASEAVRKSYLGENFNFL